MAKERRSWEDDSTIVAELKAGSAPSANAPGPLAAKASESSTLRSSEGHHEEEAVVATHTAPAGEAEPRSSEATAV
jgi:hypothetical protein